MSVYIPDSFRSFVAERALYKCEYCRTPESNSFYKFQIDHIISLKHGGQTELENLAYSCPICNRNKGSDLGTLLADNGPVIRFFHPRKDQWENHFEVSIEGILYPKTEEAEATIKILGMNHPDSIIERALLIKVRLYP
ncbi:MAG: HNH endonuclease signature motif containing protein [Bacteroidia bacterium]|nr:HNH endonuclease signature motif containing protein [Bacteroidia bacterium]